MRWAPTVAALALGLAALGCPEGPEPSPKKELKTLPLTETPEPTEPGLDESEIPVPADFEDEVAQEITPDNYGEKLDALEAELSE